MNLQELQKQALQLPISDRWQLVQTLLESLKRETSSELEKPTPTSTTVRRFLVKLQPEARLQLEKLRQQTLTTLTSPLQKLSLQQETSSELKKGNLSRLRGIAKTTETSGEDVETDYINYLTQKYQ
jgi:hypothetical protein